MNPHISLALLTKNDQKNIEMHFNWLKDIKTIDEIVVVDDFSNDKTISSLKSIIDSSQTLKVYKRHLKGNFSQQRQYLISKTKNNWILWLDPDEQLSTPLISYLLNFSPKANIDSYQFVRQEIFLGHKLNHGQAITRVTRLFDKNQGCFRGKVHEIWVSSSGLSLNLYLYHHSNLTIDQALKKINFYTDIRSGELFDQKITTNIFEIICYPIAKFIQVYIVKLGLLDGIPGIILSLLMSFHSFLVRAKLWHLYKKQSST